MTNQPNLRIWSQVEKTNPAHTKHVNQRGGFTAISAAYQIMRATEVFGPIGQGWGYDAAPPIFHGDLVFVPVTLWHSGDRSAVFGPMFGGAEVSQKGRLDSDALKKATTDALTKLLSQLGFNADVFLGRFDDNKYVADLRSEFAEENGQPRREPPVEPVLTTSMTEGKDWWGCNGERGNSAHAAKNAGLDKTHDEFRQEIAAAATTEALGDVCRRATPLVKTMPLAWRIELRADADLRGEELGANPNERRAA